MSSNNVLNMIGGGFQHAFSSCGWDKPNYVVWNKDTFAGDVSVYIDEAIVSIRPRADKMNIAWFAESPFFLNQIINRLKKNPDTLDYVMNNFKYVFTSNKEILKEFPQFTYIIPTARPWVKEKKIFPKSKWASIIASNKTDAPGHQLRHMIIKQYGDAIDAYGRGYVPIEDKGEGLNDYLYSFAIENTQCDGYFTEKISDCFATGTIPIYWGDNTISEYFEQDGIIKLTDGFDPDILTPELYKNKKSVIEENYNRVINLPLPEDEIYLKYLK